MFAAPSRSLDQSAWPLRDDSGQETPNHVNESPPGSVSVLILTMKILRLFVLFLALLCTVVAPSPARARAEVSFDFFYDTLAPYGDWIEVGGYGLCWTPTNVDRDWSPYS